MGLAAMKKTTYSDLDALPDNVIGEIVGGELFATPRPSSYHSRVSSELSIEIGSAYLPRRKDGGGWVIMFEPELYIGDDVLVPDLAGWRRERFPKEPEGNGFKTPPDWICEVLSPSTAKLDRVRKMPMYAKFGVGHLWIIDPTAKILEAFQLKGAQWLLLGTYGGHDVLRVEPFADVELQLGHLWWES